MLRCAGVHASRLISKRVTAAAAVSTSSVVAGTRPSDLPLLHRDQSRSASSWLTPTPAPLASAHSEGGGGSGGFGIATGLELEELEAQREGKKRFLDPPRGPFGTKEHPALVESSFDERIVGCSGGVGAEDEHDVIWFKLKKGEEHECSVCTQVFELKVVGEGGLPGAHH